MTKYICIYAVLITLMCIVCMKRCSTLSNDNDRLSNNQTALLSDIETYKTKDGKNAARILQLEMTNDEYKKLMSDQADQIKRLGIKIRHLESISTTGTETETGGKTPIRDSVIITYVDSVRYVDSIRYFEWKDTWSTISGVITKDSVDCKYRGIDTLQIIAHRVPKLFLGFIPCGTKYIQTEVYNANENTKIVYTQDIKLQKKKRK